MNPTDLRPRMRVLIDGKPAVCKSYDERNGLHVFDIQGTIVKFFPCEFKAEWHRLELSPDASRFANSQKR